jgi:hypothetical protein
MSEAKSLKEWQQEWPKMIKRNKNHTTDNQLDSIRTIPQLLLLPIQLWSLEYPLKNHVMSIQKNKSFISVLTANVNAFVLNALFMVNGL